MDQASAHHHKQVFEPKNVFEKIRRLVDFASDSKLRVLDVGCGPGILDDYLESLGHEVVGLDIHEFSERLQNNKYILADVSKKWPVPDKSFNVVICTDVAEHLYDPAFILKEAQRVLVADGSLIFGVPNHFDLRQRLRMLFGGGIVHWDNLRHKEESPSYVHIRFFILPELFRMFQENGWQVGVRQFNFMGGGLVPRRLTPAFFRQWLVRLWPGLFSGKFIFLLKKTGGQPMGEPKQIHLASTPFGY